MPAQEEEALKQELLTSEFSGEGSVVGPSVLMNPAECCPQSCV